MLVLTYLLLIKRRHDRSREMGVYELHFLFSNNEKYFGVQEQ
jgi:hypothetical protein